MSVSRRRMPLLTTAYQHRPASAVLLGKIESHRSVTQNGTRVVSPLLRTPRRRRWMLQCTKCAASVCRQPSRYFCHVSGASPHRNSSNINPHNQPAIFFLNFPRRELQLRTHSITQNVASPKRVATCCAASSLFPCRCSRRSRGVVLLERSRSEWIADRRVLRDCFQAGKFL